MISSFVSYSVHDYPKGIQSTTLVINCNLDIELFSSCLCFRPWTCMHDGWCIACVFAAGTKWMSSGSGGCRSSRVPQSSRRQGRAREELEPRIRCWETESVQGWKPGLVREGAEMSYYWIRISLVKKRNKSMWPGGHIRIHVAVSRYLSRIISLAVVKCNKVPLLRYLHISLK